MKKILLTIITASIVALLFSSCLGDNHASYETSSTPTYIKANEKGGVHGVANMVLFSSNVINDLKIGRIYDLGFKVVYKNPTADRIYAAERVSVNGDGIPYAKGEYQYNSTKPTYPGEIYFSKTGVTFFHEEEQLANDIWGFNFDFYGYEEDLLRDDFGDYTNIKIIASLVTDNQSTSVSGDSKVDLAHNQAIVNLYLVRVNEPVNPAAVRQMRSGRASIDFSSVRNYFESRVEFPSSNGNTATWVRTAIQFQYITGDKDGAVVNKENKLGSLDVSSNLANYTMVIVKE